MKIATVRDFKINTTRYLASDDEVVVTRRGTPVAVVTPIRPKTPAAMLYEMRMILKDSGISRKEALGMLAAARRETYG